RDPSGQPSATSPVVAVLCSSSAPPFSCIPRPPPRPTLFPYTTLFRSSTLPHAPRLKRLEDFTLQDIEAIRLILTGTSVIDWYRLDRKSTRLNSSHVKISYAVFCLKKKQNMSSGIVSLDIHQSGVCTPA